MSEESNSTTPLELLICVNKRMTAVSCAGRGSEAVADAIEHGVMERGLAVEIIRIHCFGRCELGPNLRVIGKEFHHHVDLEQVPDILDALSEAEHGRAKPTS